MTAPNIKAFVFDAYGTLLDVHSAVRNMSDEIGPDAQNISEIWRTKQLEYSWLRSMMQAHSDFWQVTSDALTYAMKYHGIENRKLHDKLMNMYLNLTSYKDAVTTLKEIKNHKYSTIVLSNGSQGMLNKSIENAGLHPLLDKAISIDEVGVYKPSPKVYELGTDYVQCKPEEILFVSANAWDVAGANHFGYRVAWINRFKRPPEILPGKPEFIIESLSELEQLYQSKK
ncbi:haloacid dehalogenase [Kiloniella litopenaei]|uniref:(S)-2-haloacid dehalogenase n=1 Tax=Kiloniella litopenaei TaxID=1549748 RepID=A0A0M2RAY9_9PROT|nr:haloacid dehalogenase type II [Kiloniella litopenaei]KKJ76778.1 haloacid dehalogenase [Kiloniella litopenaei]